MTTEKENKLLVIRINAELKKNYQLFCIKNDHNMSERIRKFMEEDLKKNETKC